MPFGDDEFDRTAARVFTVRYTLALGLVALLTLAAQVAVQVALYRARTDAEVVNLAGRQRMLSQRLTMQALASERDPARAAAVAQVLTTWLEAHARLTRGTDLANAGVNNSPQVAAAFAAIEPHVQAMATAATPPIDAAALLMAQESFLAGMENIVALYASEAEARVQHLIALELSLCGILLVVLVFEALLVFRPAVARLRAAIADRERLAEQRLINRELEVAVATARAIGQDLHDGLGQTLTALTFQAKALEQAAGAGPLGQAARKLGEGISQAIAQCRAQARRLAPVDIQAVGLEAALRELADATASASGAECCLAWTAPGPPPSASEDLYRIAQEAVSNALRHGRARRILIRAGPEGLVVEDDGVGGTPSAEGVGMRSMRARAARLGAHLEIGPRPEGGWRVCCTMQRTSKHT